MRPHPRVSVDVNGLTVRPTASRSEYTVFVTDTDGAVYRVAGHNQWDDTEVYRDVAAGPGERTPSAEVNARVRGAALVGAPMLLPFADRRLTGA